MNKEQLEEVLLTEELLLEELYAKKKSIETQIKEAQERRDNTMFELNKDFMNDMKWLIKNPAVPCHYEAMKDKLKKLYGGDYNGPHESGYMTRDHNCYIPVQSNFEFFLCVYGDLRLKEQRIANCKHFVDNYIDAFEPLLDVTSRYNNQFGDKKMVGFQFRSSMSNGLDYLGYEPLEKTWYWFTMRYSLINIEKKFKNFDEAIEFAFDLANQAEPDD
jgi:hypothetical protein